MAKKEPALEAAFKRLAKSASQLNDASERVNALVEEAERRLAEASVGMSVALSEWVSTSGDNRWDMAYEKYRGAWRIVARRFDPGDPDAPPTLQEVLPMVSAPRFVRIAAVAQLPQLVHALAEKAEAAFNGIPTVEDKDSGFQASDEDVPF